MKKFKHFMSNPCGYPHCMEWECEYCNHFKPYLFKIRVPRWFGKLLFEFEEYLFFKHWQKTHNDDGKGEF